MRFRNKEEQDFWTQALMHSGVNIDTADAALDALRKRSGKPNDMELLLNPFPGVVAVLELSRGRGVTGSPKVDAIKELRGEILGLGLKEAKEAVEHYQEHGSWAESFLVKHT